MFTETGVEEVNIEDESELGLEEERVTCPIHGGFAEIQVLILFFLTSTKHGEEDLAFFPSKQ